MATDSKTEMTTSELLQFYIGLCLERDRNVPVEQILKDFPEYLRERRTMRNMIRDAEESIAAGRSGPLDLEKAIDEVVRDLAAEGHTG
jgi:hypothetical protein